MLARERQQIIIQKIMESGSVQCEVLAKELDVSLMTIRRDLEKLKQEGCIERFHGGAVLKKETPYMDKQVSNLSDKELIARKAVEYIETGDTVFLDAGTTTYNIAKLIMDRTDLTIVTNDIEIAHLLKESPMEVIVCGGVIQSTTGSMLGMFANEVIRHISINISFLGAASIDNHFFVLTPTMQKSEFKSLVVRNSLLSYLVVDESKFNKRAMLKINHLKDYTGVITNKEFDEREQAGILRMNINVIPV
ncbi:MAG: DeoR/GlpR family DNA-binding transcription regulator [bacterium]|nr:DeoR/GlpR family DNA-binding transcription regulator [bacterium]